MATDEVARRKLLEKLQRNLDLAWDAHEASHEAFAAGRFDEAERHERRWSRHSRLFVVRMAEYDAMTNTLHRVV